MKKFILLFFPLFLFSYTIDFNTAINITLEQNKELQAKKLDIEVAKQDLIQAKGYELISQGRVSGRQLKPDESPSKPQPLEGHTLAAADILVSRRHRWSAGVEDQDRSEAPYGSRCRQETL